MPFVGTELFRRDILEEHFESLEFLWRQRRGFLRAAGISLRDLADHDERIAAHADGLALAGADGVDLVREVLASEDDSIGLAAAHVLLATRDAELSRLVTEALGADLPPAGLAQALCHVPIDLIDSELQLAAGSNDDALAAAAAEALAVHGRPFDSARLLPRLLKASVREIRKTAWRIVVALVRPGATPPVDRTAFEQGAADDDEQVRALSLEAAAWWRQPWLLERCRGDAQAFSALGKEAALMVAVLGGPQDLGLMAALGAESALGPSRFDMLASHGHPGVLDALLATMEAAGAAPADAAAAGAAFTRITGVDVGSGMRVPVPPPGTTATSDFDEEFFDDVELPNTAVAREGHSAFRTSAGEGTRFFRGMLIGGQSDTLQIVSSNLLDLRARWEMALRLAYAGRPGLLPSQLDRFPIRL